MVSTSGSKLLPAEAANIVRAKLLPLATILTPNIPEAILLLQGSGVDANNPENLEDAIQIAKQIHTLGPKYVLLKGGHLPLTSSFQKVTTDQQASKVVDVLYDGENVTLFENEFLTSQNTHGTGCSLASAIAANLAQGMDMVRAVRAACRFVEAGIRTSVDMGKGNGPINHFHSVYSLPFASYVLRINFAFVPYLILSPLPFGLGKATELTVLDKTKKRPISRVCTGSSRRPACLESLYGARVCGWFGHGNAACGKVQGLFNPGLSLFGMCVTIKRVYSIVFHLIVVF